MGESFTFTGCVIVSYTCWSCTFTWLHVGNLQCSCLCRKPALKRKFKMLNYRSHCVVWWSGCKPWFHLGHPCWQTNLVLQSAPLPFLRYLALTSVCQAQCVHRQVSGICKTHLGGQLKYPDPTLRNSCPMVFWWWGELIVIIRLILFKAESYLSYSEKWLNLSLSVLWWYNILDHAADAGCYYPAGNLSAKVIGRWGVGGKIIWERQGSRAHSNRVLGF